VRGVIWTEADLVQRPRHADQLVTPVENILVLRTALWGKFAKINGLKTRPQLVAIYYTNTGCQEIIWTISV
jgi:hypothetical protein